MTPKARLVQLQPLMQCANKVEFRQRLQWLSEGMLRNHLAGGSEPDRKEQADYKAYKAETATRESPPCHNFK